MYAHVDYTCIAQKLQWLLKLREYLSSWTLASKSNRPQIIATLIEQDLKMHRKITRKVIQIHRPLSSLACRYCMVVNFRGRKLSRIRKKWEFYRLLEPNISRCGMPQKLENFREWLSNYQFASFLSRKFPAIQQGLFQGGRPGGAFAPPLSNWLSLSLICGCPPLDLDLPPPLEFWH